MLTEEYGLPQEVRSPWRAAVSTFSAFLLCGLVPLVPFLFDSGRPVILSVVLTAGVFFVIGSVRSKWSTSSWWFSGLSTLLVGTAAAGLAYVIGALLRQWMPQTGA
jgi:VIT1/CCC1 family predicted Fe2+/Mn2+ transporter